MRRTLCCAAVVYVLSTGSSLVGPASVHAQETPATPEAGRTVRSEPFRVSPYLPLDHWAYAALDHWIAAGRITSLSPWVQPYRRIEVARAIAGIGAASLGAGERGWLQRLRAELATELSEIGDGAGRDAGPMRDAGVGLQLSGGGRYYGQTHRDVLRPELEGEFSEGRVLEEGGLDVDARAGVVAGALRIWRKGMYRNDAQFPDGQVVLRRDGVIVDDLSLRVEEGYLELQTRYARVSYGRMYRNWGAPGLPGFLRSSYAYSEDEIGYRIGTDRVFIVGMFASYSDFLSDTTHYVAMHRLELRPFDDLMIGLSESSVHGGPGEGLDFRLVMPITIWALAGDERKTAFNKAGQLDLWWHATDGLNLYGSLLTDATNREGSCCQLGGSLGMELPRLAPGLGLRVNFTAIQSLAYRTNVPWEEYSVENVGLGWDKVDLYLASLEADWLPVAGLWLRPKLDLLRKGEGDFRELRPDAETGFIPPGFPRILIGEVETTIRPALAGRWRTGGRFALDVEWDVGVNLIRDYNHVPGDDRTELVATIGARLSTPRWEFGWR